MKMWTRNQVDYSHDNNERELLYCCLYHSLIFLLSYINDLINSEQAQKRSTI